MTRLVEVILTLRGHQTFRRFKLSNGILDFGFCKDCEVSYLFSTSTAQAVEVYIVQLIVSEGEQTKRSKCS